MQCKSLWIKASAKCINVNSGVQFTQDRILLQQTPSMCWEQFAYPVCASVWKNACIVLTWTTSTPVTDIWSYWATEQVVGGEEEHNLSVFQFPLPFFFPPFQLTLSPCLPLYPFVLYYTRPLLKKQTPCRKVYGVCQKKSEKRVTFTECSIDHLILLFK